MNGSLNIDWGKTTSFIGLHYETPIQNIGSIIVVYYAVFVSFNVSSALLGHGNISITYAKRRLCIQTLLLIIIVYFN